MDDDRAMGAERRARTAALPGMTAEALARLAAARVVVVGAGGLGSPVLEYLAASGVAALGIIDDDLVDVSNLQRQVIHAVAEVGQPKVDSAARAIARIAPEVAVDAHRVRLDAGNALDLLRGWDAVVDASDNLPTRYLISDAAALLGLPVVWGSVLRYEGQVAVFWDAAPGGGVDYRDLHPDPPDPATVLDCAQAGVLGPLCGVIGSAMAVETLKLVTGVGSVEPGLVRHHDALSGEWTSIRVRRSPTRRPVDALIDYDGFCGVARIPAEAETDLGAPEAAGRILLDVRTRGEREAGHLPGDRWLPVDELLADPSAAGPGPFLVYCASGVRSARAAAALRGTGVDAVSLRGGWDAGWDAGSAAGERRQHVDAGAVDQD